MSQIVQVMASSSGRNPLIVGRGKRSQKPVLSSWYELVIRQPQDGQLTDAQGRTVSFRNTILIGTSNLGTEALTPEKRPIGFIKSEIPNYQEAKGLVMHEVKKVFKPEFLNRLDDVIVFHYLEKDHVRQIASMFVQELAQRMSVRDITTQVDQDVIDKLATDGFDPVYGARPLRREVERQVENPLAMKMVKGECPAGSHVRIALKDGSVTFSVGDTARARSDSVV